MNSFMDLLGSPNSERFLEMLINEVQNDLEVNEQSPCTQTQPYEQSGAPLDPAMDIQDEYIEGQLQRKQVITGDMRLNTLDGKPNQVLAQPEQITEPGDSQLYHEFDRISEASTSSYTPVTSTVAHSARRLETQQDSMPMGNVISSTRTDGNTASCPDRSSSPQVTSTTSRRKARGSAGMTATPLPPCKICGDISSGYHFGAVTCEACKAFYRRCMRRKTELVCPLNDECELKPHKRALCPACRYRKCLEMGMSKDAVKIGRYTLERKSNFIKEVKNSETPIASTSPRKRKLEKDKATEMRKKEFVIQQKVERTTSKDILDNILRAHHEQLVIPKSSLTFIKEQQRKYVAEAVELKGMLGDMADMRFTDEEYMNLYESTGLDIDGRRQKISDVLPNMEISLTKLINFAKSIPGFMDIALDDRMILIKACAFDWWVLGVYHAVDLENGLVTSPFGATKSKADMRRFSSERMCEVFFDTVELLQKLRLSEVHLALLKAMTIMSSDRIGLQNPDVIESHQGIIVEAINNCQTIAGSEKGTIISRIFRGLTAIRNLSNVQSKEVNPCQKPWAKGLQIPLIVKEVLGEPKQEL